MTEQLYCPICANKLDRHQDCWIPCEYEAAYASAEYRPLTREQALQKRLSEKLISLGFKRLGIKKLETDIVELRQELRM